MNNLNISIGKIRMIIRDGTVWFYHNNNNLNGNTYPYRYLSDVEYMYLETLFNIKYNKYSGYSISKGEDVIAMIKKLRHLFMN